MNTKTRNISVALLLAFFTLGASGCNTIRGIGKDTEKAGEKIQTEADEQRDGDKDNKPN